MIPNVHISYGDTAQIVVAIIFQHFIFVILHLVSEREMVSLQ